MASSIFDTPPQPVVENLKLLCEDLNAKIPSKQLDKNLLIATWNIRAFGDLTREWESQENDSPKRDLQSILCITEIIRRFDVIAVQEVKSNIRALRDTIKLLGEDWSLILTDVTKGDAGNGERMAFIFDTRRVKLSGLACELVVPKEWSNGIGVNALDEQFVRTPYAVSFKSCNQTFILVTLHIKYGKKSADRIAWFLDNQNVPNLSLEFLQGGNYDFVPTALVNRGLTKQSLSFMMSDHYPLWAEFKL